MSTARRLWLPVLIACMTLLQACAGLKDRSALRDTLVRDAAWESHIIATRQFDIAAASPARRTGNVLVAYLEGDGRAYLDASMVSVDPTPSDPISLRMALADSRHGPLVYLARPCQYTLPEHGRNCSNVYWTSHRYAPAIIDSIGQALDQEKQRAGASKLVLVGYSGGGALAVLLAQRRTDVAAIVTVAANLDLAYWISRDGLVALDGSIDPAADASSIGSLPQLHLAGADDKVVGPDVTRAFLQRMAGDIDGRMLVIPGFNHVCCWATQWSALLHRPDVRRIMQSDSVANLP